MFEKLNLSKTHQQELIYNLNYEGY